LLPHCINSLSNGGNGSIDNGVVFSPEHRAAGLDTAFFYGQASASQHSE